MELARVNAQRWANLVTRGVVSKQDNDQYQAQYQSQVAGVQCAREGGCRRSAATCRRLKQPRASERMRGYRIVQGAFRRRDYAAQRGYRGAGQPGSTLLYRIAQTETLRTYVNVPQSEREFHTAGTNGVD